ncbi:MAG: HAD hydrolase family protein [Burkholderiales bacterium]|nr:HAD hydrolase family protein [Burkholderiales bacterium]
MPLSAPSPWPSPPPTPSPVQPRLRPLGDLPLARLARLRGVLTDIDDTLTRDGAIEPEALTALRALGDAGVPVIAITGRPAGWSEPMVRAWPVLAIVAENGAVMLRRGADESNGHGRCCGETQVQVQPHCPGEPPAGSHDPGGRQGGLRVDFTVDAATRAANWQKLQACAADIVAHIPGAVQARDSAGRLTDIAIDHSEFTQLGDQAIDAVVATMRAHGLTATVSSIHINGWIGGHNKLSAAHWAVQACLGIDFVAEDWVYVGDSTNDQLMFEHVPLSVGVANVARFVPVMTTLPGWVTQAERGQGFAELAVRVLAACRAGAHPATPDDQRG